MSYVLVSEANEVLEYPVTPAVLQQRYPYTSFTNPLNPEDLVEFGVVQVTQSPQPAHDETVEYLQETTPVFVNDTFSQQWAVVPYSEEYLSTAESRQAVSVRLSRDEALKASDWTQLADSPLSDADKAAWATYRQELRDITEQEGFPNDITWPVSPDSGS